MNLSSIKIAGLATMLCFTTIGAIAQNGYQIKGRMVGLTQPSMAYLYSFDKGRNLLDSAVVTDGSFTFTGKVKHPLSASVQIKKIRKSLSLFLENDNYVLVMHQDWKDKDSISGGEEMRIERAYGKDTAELMKQMQVLAERYSKLGKEERINEGEEMNKLNEKIGRIQRSYIQKYPASLAVLHIMRPQFDVMNYKQLQEMKSLFSPLLAYSDVYQHLTELLAKKKAEFLVGQQAPDFSLPDLSGKSIALSSLKGKYVVVDFWASWCTPCRAANQKIKPLYDKYKNKGFEMISVSMDDKKELWVNAIKKDGLPWLQVSELIGIKGSEVAKKYSVSSLPTVFLLDPSGKVIAQNISEKELEEILHTNLK
ncbi:MAG: TlpA disulfide reductase family protein [Candidatus Pedobacter colombiensis]|uniref:TlpA disulfide reductase family protein n=1 Tax=Candidatus Pedobacter colombiensis TaxID=3121371 RepID=A0AAJ5W8I7_9SPHI|nr:TlpA disulfide reductase family protein [Pedobacter sp.]WEK19987.1 MAG: TlpA disulfide reductase family protein [Pedobacter sp.]